jgi:hypothetical protein
MSDFEIPMPDWWLEMDEDERPSEERVRYLMAVQAENLTKEQFARDRGVNLNPEAMIQQRISLLAQILLNQEGMIEFDIRFAEFLGKVLDEALKKPLLMMPTNMQQLPMQPIQPNRQQRRHPGNN